MNGLAGFERNSKLKDWRKHKPAMSIRMIARDLYRLEKEVETLEQRLKAAPAEQRRDLEEQLRKARAERDRMRRVLEGSKEPPSYRKPLR